MRNSSPTLVLFSLLAVSFFVSACSSGPAPSPVRESAGTGVTVVGWSLRDQAPVPVQGFLRQAGQEPVPFNTKARPDSTTVTVVPGPYEVQVTHRFAGDRAVPSSGLERVDARPGEVVRCEVVVDDREGHEGPGDHSR